MARYKYNLSEKELETEEWRMIPGYDGLYSVSNLGRVKRELAANNYPPGHILNAVLASVYPSLSLRLKGRRRMMGVHQLVMLAFVGSCPKGFQINHKDCDKLNPRLSNLEYVTQKQNAEHAVLMGRYRRGETNGRAIVSDMGFRIIRRLNLSIHDLCHIFGTSKTQMRRLQSGHRS